VTCLRGERASAHAVVVQSTGQVMAVGRTNGPNGDFNFALARYNNDGSLDATFNPDSINPGVSITDFDNRADGKGGSERSFDEALAAAICSGQVKTDTQLSDTGHFFIIIRAHVPQDMNGATCCCRTSQCNRQRLNELLAASRNGERCPLPFQAAKESLSLARARRDDRHCKWT
jgi:hypothetical protein